MNLTNTKNNFKSNLLNRIASATQQNQLATWENDGGYQRFYDYAVLINGRLCTGTFARIYSSFAHVWKIIFNTFKK